MMNAAFSGLTVMWGYLKCWQVEESYAMELQEFRTAEHNYWDEVVNLSPESFIGHLH